MIDNASWMAFSFLLIYFVVVVYLFYKMRKAEGGDHKAIAFIRGVRSVYFRK